MAKNKINVYTKDRGVLNIKIVPNQKVVEIHKVNPKGKMLDISSNKEAMRMLSPNGYILYMHFVLNIPGYKEALSSKYITENTKFKNYELIQADRSFDEFYNWYDYFAETESYCNVYKFTK